MDTINLRPALLGIMPLPALLRYRNKQDHWKLVEEGTRGQLLAKKGIHQHLYALQLSTLR
jgi:hypothetical protein